MRRIVNSAGILLKCGDNFFLVHSTGSPKDEGWGIPKGRVDAGESLEQAAVRETKEECGLTVDPSDIKLLSTIDYNSRDEHGNIRKVLHIFLCNVPTEMMSHRFYCDSYFSDRRNQNIKIPEIDNFGWFDKDVAKKIATKSFKQIFDLF